MLSGVLLHVVETTLPIDRAFNGSGRQRFVDDVEDQVPLVPNIKDGGVAKSPTIVRLAAGSGIEKRAIQDNAPCRRGRSRFSLWCEGHTTKHLGLKIMRERVVIIMALRGPRCHSPLSLVPFQFIGQLFPERAACMFRWKYPADIRLK